MRKIITILTMSLLCSCGNNPQNMIEFKQIPTTYSVVVSRSKNMNDRYEIKAFFKYEVRKKNMFKCVNSDLWGVFYSGDSIHLGLSSHILVNGNLEHNTTELVLSWFKKKNIIIGSYLCIDSTNQYYPLIAHDIERLKFQRKDTIHIGSITDLEKRNPLFLDLLRIDSIRLSFYYDKGFHSMYIPVKMK